MTRILMWGISEGITLLVDIEVWEDKLVLKNYDFIGFNICHSFSSKEKGIHLIC